MTGKTKNIFFAASIFWFSMLMTGLPSFAQDVRFQAAASKTTVSEGEKFRLEFSLNASGEQFTPPKFEGFRILSGPNQSTNMQFVNGRSSYTISYSYVLMALKEGEFAIQPATIRSPSGLISSNAINIKVVKGNAPAQPQAGQPSGKQGNPAQESGEINSDDVENNLFITASVTNSSPFVGEQFTATYKLYFNFNIVDNSFTTLPSLNGFWSEDLELQNNERETEVINGVRYNVAILKKSILIPQRSGELVLDPLEMDLVIQQPVQSRSRNLFDQFFGNYRNVKVSLKSRPVRVQVRALPGDKPAGFSGAVGDIRVTLKTDRLDVKANEAINVKYEISGKGNLKLLNAPSLNFPSDFEVYDPKTEDKITSNSSGLSGSRSYNYLVIPRHKGNYVMEKTTFSYFDPSKERYVTISVPELIFNIEKGEEESPGAVSFSNTSKEDIKLLGSDIRYIKTNTVLLPQGYGFFGSMLFYFLWFLPLPLFLLVWFANRNIQAKRNDAVYMKKSKANKMAEKRLSVARKLQSAGDDKKFYEEIFKALYGFFEYKFNISTSEISKEKINEVLLANGFDPAIIQKTDDLLNRCEMARFAKVSDVSHEEVYNDAVSLLSVIQKGLK